MWIFLFSLTSEIKAMNEEGVKIEDNGDGTMTVSLPNDEDENYTPLDVEHMTPDERQALILTVRAKLQADRNSVSRGELKDALRAGRLNRASGPARTSSKKEKSSAPAIVIGDDFF